jgi:DNA-binding NtrC family response regulator
MGGRQKRPAEMERAPSTRVKTSRSIPVARQTLRAALEAVAEAHPTLQSAEAVWDALRRTRRGLPESFDARGVAYHHLQFAYEFGIAELPEGREPFLRRCGERFAMLLFEERLPELLKISVQTDATIVRTVELLFDRFMREYTSGTYEHSFQRSGRERLALSLRFADAAGMADYLAGHGLDARRSFENSFLCFAAVLSTALERFVEPWKPSYLQAEGDRIEIRFPEDAEFNYPRLIGTLTDYVGELQRRHQERLFAQNLEQDLLLHSPFMRDKWERIKRAAATDELILLRGEPGSGKTHLARKIHQLSARKNGPFVEVAMTSDVGSDNFVRSSLFGHVKGAFTGATEEKPGYFALAGGGTLFLDEIGDASLELQAALLRVIDAKVYKMMGGTADLRSSARIIAATNRDLEGMVREGRFREDLYHRLNLIQIEMTPLRERAFELPALCDHFLRVIASETGREPKRPDPEALAVLLSYEWPGNVRELIHTLKYAELFARDPELIRREDLPEQFAKVRRRPAAPVAPAAAGNEEVIDLPRLCDLLSKSDSVPLDRKRAAELPWHIEHAKKVWLRALIQHCRGNIRRITEHWERRSERAVRTLIRRYGLWKELEAARRRG